MENLRKAYKKKWPKRNLGELLAFLEKQHPEGLVLSDISLRTGLSPQSLSYTFVRDDMRLSAVERIYRSYGYELNLLFPIKDYSIYGLDSPPVKEAVRKEYPEAGNLQGLVRYMNDSNITPYALMTRIGRNSDMLLRALKKGDIFVSVLYEILEELNIEIIWDAKALPKT